jgi:hypothetical protein
MRTTQETTERTMGDLPGAVVPRVDIPVRSNRMLTSYRPAMKAAVEFAACIDR